MLLLTLTWEKRSGKVLGLAAHMMPFKHGFKEYSEVGNLARTWGLWLDDA